MVLLIPRFYVATAQDTRRDPPNDIQSDLKMICTGMTRGELLQRLRLDSRQKVNHELRTETGKEHESFSDCGEYDCSDHNAFPRAHSGIC